MGRYTMTEKEATIQQGSNDFLDYVSATRKQEEYEPYWHYSERQRPYSEFNEKSLSNYMWQKWGIK